MALRKLLSLVTERSEHIQCFTVSYKYVFKVSRKLKRNYSQNPPKRTPSGIGKSVR